MKTNATKWILATACIAALAVPLSASAEGPRRHPPRNGGWSQCAPPPQRPPHWNRPAPTVWVPAPVVYTPPPPPPPLVVYWPAPPPPPVVYPPGRPGFQVIFSF